MKLVGYTVKSGTYENRPFKNAYLYFVDAVQETENIKPVGTQIKTLKVKYDLFLACLQQKGIALDKVVGADLKPYYNEYGNMIGFM